LSIDTVTGQVVKDPAVLQRGDFGAVARTALFNATSAAASAVGGIIVARVVGPSLRGEYAAIVAWFGVLLLIGGLGQSAAVCFYVASDPLRARGYVATSGAMMVVTGSCALCGGVIAAPALAHGNPELTGTYRLVFACSVIAFIGTSYMFSLQAVSMRRWNLVRISQPALTLTAIIVLRLLGLLTLDTAIGAVLASMTFQLGHAYYWCRRCGLAPGHVQPAFIRPLVKMGLAQLMAITPAAVNSCLDQLVLSQLVSPADLGRYAIAVSATMAPVPLVSAIGNVAFPRLAAFRGTPDAHRVPLAAVAVGAGIASAVLLPLAASGCWLIPAVFGPAYRGAVPLLWILTPGGIFLASGQVVGDLLRGLSRPGVVAMAQGVTAVGAVILLVILLPVAGIAAAAIASTLGYGTALALMIRWLLRPPCPGRVRHWLGRPGASGVPPGNSAEKQGNCPSGRRLRGALPGQDSPLDQGEQHVDRDAEQAEQQDDLPHQRDVEGRLGGEHLVADAVGAADELGDDHHDQGQGQAEAEPGTDLRGRAGQDDPPQPLRW
jgi:O-antigen/teichoic acid export membrane protein